tara:strand:- start:249 stop:527 length:279 start_codon:yes stop_codon:yes gene_type:complete
MTGLESMEEGVGLLSITSPKDGEQHRTVGQMFGEGAYPMGMDGISPGIMGTSPGVMMGISPTWSMPGSATSAGGGGGNFARAEDALDVVSSK